MIIEWKNIAIIIMIITISLIAIKIISKKKPKNPEIYRKTFHITMGLTMISFPYLFKNPISVGILGILALIFMYILKKTKLKDSLGTVLYSVNRESYGEIFFILAVFLIFYLSKGNKILYSIPILILTFADSAAALIGKNYGKNNLSQSSEDAKSIEGSFMFFIVAFMATLVPLLLFTTVGREETLIISTIIGFNVSLVEMISHSGNDNLFIPLTSYAFLITHIFLDISALRRNLIILLTIFLIVTVVNRIKVLSKLALVESLVIGYLTVILYGVYAIIPPFIMFMTCMNLPKLREIEKNNLYDSKILETNILIGISICALAAITGLRKELFIPYIMCYTLHLSINTFVRLKYYFNLSELDSLIIGYFKGFILIFIPGIIINKNIFQTSINPILLIIMMIIILLGCLTIMIAKRKVKKEEISVENGYLHMKIVGIYTILTGIIQYIFK